jgi:hypothetical protein
MARDYSTNELVQSVKRRAMLPTNQSTFTAERVAAILDEEMQSTIVQMVLAVGGEHLVSWTDYTLTSAVEYDVPPTALGDRVRDAVLIDPSTGLHLTDLAVVSLDRVHQASTYEPAILLRANKIVMVPASRPGETLRVYFHRRPNRLVWTTRAAQIASIDVGTGVVTVSGTVPSVMTTGQTLSVIPSVPPFEERDNQPEITNVATPDITLDSVTGLEVGDWLALEGESPIPQLPADVHAALAQRGAWRVLSALGSPAAQAAESSYMALAEQWQLMATPRVEGEPQLVIGADDITDALDRGGWGWTR